MSKKNHFLMNTIAQIRADVKNIMHVSTSRGDIFDVVKTELSNGNQIDIFHFGSVLNETYLSYKQGEDSPIVFELTQKVDEPAHYHLSCNQVVDGDNIDLISEYSFADIKLVHEVITECLNHCKSVNESAARDIDDFLLLIPTPVDATEHVSDYVKPCKDLLDEYLSENKEDIFARGLRLAISVIEVFAKDHQPKFIYSTVRNNTEGTQMEMYVLTFNDRTYEIRVSYIHTDFGDDEVGRMPVSISYEFSDIESELSATFKKGDENIEVTFYDMYRGESETQKMVVGLDPLLVSTTLCSGVVPAIKHLNMDNNGNSQLADDINLN